MVGVLKTLTSNNREVSIVAQYIFQLLNLTFFGFSDV